MNERIKELAQQAGESVVTELFEEYMLTETEDGATLKVPSVFIAKFAELIVQECAGICDKDYARSGQDGAGWRLAREIEEHFGVEE